MNGSYTTQYYHNLLHRVNVGRVPLLNNKVTQFVRLYVPIYKLIFVLTVKESERATSPVSILKLYYMPKGFAHLIILIK